MDKIETFVKRLNKIGINIELSCNFPWIYIDKINGKLVTEKYCANHGFTLGFYPIKADQSIQFTNISEIFKLIRKYI